MFDHQSVCMGDYGRCHIGSCFRPLPLLISQRLVLCRAMSGVTVRLRVKSAEWRGLRPYARGADKLLRVVKTAGSGSGRTVDVVAAKRLVALQAQRLLEMEEPT